MKHPENTELLKIFIEEATDLLSALSQTLLSWQQALSKVSFLDGLKRDLHTLKGGARMVNKPEMADLAHDLETICESAKQGKITDLSQAYTHLASGIDKLMSMVEDLKQNHHSYGHGDLPASKAELSNSATEHLNDIMPEYIRIKSDILEKMSNLSVESSIARLNLQHEIGIIGRTLNDIKKELSSKSEGLGNITPEEDISKLSSYIKVMTDAYAQTETLLTYQARRISELQTRLQESRLVTFQSILPRINTIVRQVSNELNKKVNLNIVKTEGEIDRSNLEHLLPALEHILRNAIDHGIERIEVRKSLNKSEAGNINLSLSRSGTFVHIEIKDDGSGIDVEKIKQKAISLGLVSKDNLITDEQAIQFIFEPGFSTKEAISQISGRGIGMDVVNSIIKEMGGSISIHTQKNQGTKIYIRIPFTFSLNRVLLVKVGEQSFAIPLSYIEGIVQVNLEELTNAFLKKKPTFQYGYRSYHLYDLGDLISEPSILKEKNIPIIILKSPEFPMAIKVDHVIASRDIMVKSLGAQFKLVPNWSGATIMPDGKVLLVLDIPALCFQASAGLTRGLVKNRTSSLTKTKRKIKILVVEDSVTLRAFAKNLLEKFQYEVVTASDGVQGLETLIHDIPDLILTDIEMPHMDGFTFMAEVKKRDPLKNIPIIVVSSRTNEAFKNKAKLLGAQGYLGKPYVEEDLIDLIKTLLEED